MFTIMRSRTVNDLEDAVFTLQEQLAAADPTAVTTSPALGCCGCGAWMADVRTEGESYCWRCVGRMGIAEYTVLTGRER